MKQYLHEIITLLGPNKNKLPKILLLFLMASILDLVGIGLIAPYVSIVIDPNLVDDIVQKASPWINLPTEQKPILIFFSTVLLGIFFIKSILSIFIHFIIIRFSVDQQIRLRTLLMSYYQSMPYIIYLKRNSAEYTHNIQTLVVNYSNSVVLFTLKTISDGMVAFGILVLLIYTDLLAFILMFVLVGSVVFGYDLLFRKKNKYYGRESNRASDQMVQAVSEGIEGLKELRTLGCNNYFLERMHKSAQMHGFYHTRSQLLSNAPRYLLELSMVVFIVCIILLSIYLNYDLQQILPVLAVFGFAAIRLLPSVNVFTISLMQLRFYRDSVSRLYQDIIKLNKVVLEDTESCNELISKSIVKDDNFRKLEIKNGYFRYSTAQDNALTNINIVINSGDSVGLIGASGAGKTTLIDVLLGFLELQTGQVLFNDKLIQDHLNEWLSHVAYIPQEVFIIDDTLRNNIALGVADNLIDEIQINKAVKKANLSEVVKQLPNGFDTILGERGACLSGGQRQRVALARAFYHKRDILIMDEATSALDNKTEKEILREIKHLKNKVTLIIIAHRLTTIKDCNHIYEIKNGSIHPYGSIQ